MDPSDPCYPLLPEAYLQCQQRLYGTPEVATHWYEQTWVPITVIGLLVVLVGAVAFMAYSRHKVTQGSL